MRFSAALILGTLAILHAGPAAAGDQPVHYSNSRKYSDRSPAATARAGGARITARMLYAKDGTTKVEVTTGELDSADVPPGSLNKVHLTGYDGLGEIIFSRTYTGLSAGGYWTQTYTDLRPGQPLEVKAHVRTDGKRNDQVTVSATVQKRPDVSVQSIAAPAKAPTNRPIQIVAAISELNGHVGARADCVLLINDTEVDRASGIWVDSGDTVSCAFSHTFPGVTVANVKVKALTVAPSEWDAGNNTSEKTIEILEPVQGYDYIAAAGVVYDRDRVGSREYGRYWNSSVTEGGDWFYETLVTREWDAFEYVGIKVDAPGTPQSLLITATDGETSWSAERALSGCEGLEWSDAGGRLVWSFVGGCAGGLWVQGGSNAGAVTYTSTVWSRTFQIKSTGLVFGTPAEYISNETTVIAPTRLKGQVWTIEFTVTTEEGFTYRGPATVNVSTPFDVGESTTQCFSEPLMNYCTESGWRQIGRFGSYEKQ